MLKITIRHLLNKIKIILYLTKYVEFEMRRLPEVKSARYTLARQSIPKIKKIVLCRLTLDKVYHAWNNTLGVTYITYIPLNGTTLGWNWKRLNNSTKLQKCLKFNFLSAKYRYCLTRGKLVSYNKRNNFLVSSTWSKMINPHLLAARKYIFLLLIKMFFSSCKNLFGKVMKRYSSSNIVLFDAF